MITINGQIPKKTKYPDGTMKLTLSPDIFESECNYIEFGWRYETEEELLDLIYVVRQVKEFKPQSTIGLSMPYIPNARMDRIYDKTEVFTLKHFCNAINNLGFTQIAVLDAHSFVSVALLNNIINTSPKPLIEEAIENVKFSTDNCLFFPDEGSCKRYSAMLPNFKNIAFGIKQRDWETGKIKGLDIFGADVKDKDIFIIDDICSFGGTVYHSAKKLKELGCKDIYVFFTHCENSIAEGELFKCGLIKKFFTTNSICTLEENENFKIIKVI